jgi:hypothetical protein
MAFDQPSGGKRYSGYSVLGRSVEPTRVVGPEMHSAPSKPREITVIDFVGSYKNPRAVVHYNDGTQEVVRREKDPLRYAAMLPVPPPTPGACSF